MLSVAPGRCPQHDICQPFDARSKEPNIPASDQERWCDAILAAFLPCIKNMPDVFSGACSSGVCKPGVKLSRASVPLTSPQVAARNSLERLSVQLIAQQHKLDDPEAVDSIRLQLQCCLDAYHLLPRASRCAPSEPPVGLAAWSWCALQAASAVTEVLDTSKADNAFVLD